MFSQDLLFFKYGVHLDSTVQHLVITEEIQKVFTTRDSASALAGRTRHAVPSRKLHIGELRNVPVLPVLLRLTVFEISSRHQRVFTLVFRLGQERLGLAHGCCCCCLHTTQRRTWSERNCCAD